jgi:hypothetical protein
VVAPEGAPFYLEIIMYKKTLIAVKRVFDRVLRRLCVSHWKRMLKLTTNQIRDNVEAPSSDNCDFCSIYMRKGCKGCPIMADTGCRGCKNTPFQHASNIYYDIKDIQNTCWKIEDFQLAVMREIEYLEELKI